MKLEDHPFFKETATDDVVKLVEMVEESSFKAGDVIFDEGSPSDGLYLMLEGTVAFNKLMPDGQQRTISYSSEGNFFGEVGIFTGDPRSLSALAQTDVRIGKIHRMHLIEFIKNTPGPIEQILGSIVNHLHHTTRHYVEDMLEQEKMTVVGNMVNTIIHDFKNPFTLISLGAQLIKAQHQDEKTSRLCNNIEAQVGRMVEMANEIIEFSKGEQSLKLAKVDLASLIEKFRELNEPFFKQDGANVVLNAESVIIEGEENKLLRVIQNLVGNAIDAFEDKKSGKVEVTVREVGTHAEIIVKDNGKGIPKQIRENLFTPFVTFGKSGGTGLGTAIVKSIVEAHNGSINFETADGVGTTFTIVLPKVAPAEAKP